MYFDENENSTLTDFVAGIVSCSTLDFPGIASSVIYMRDCIMQCPYCHNMNLVQYTRGTGIYSRLHITRMIQRNKGMVDGLVISGGEPLVHDKIVKGILECNDLEYSGHRLGFKYTKLDTCGLLYIPNELFDGLVTYFAVDIKAPRDKYGMFVSQEVAEHGLRTHLDTLEYNISRLVTWYRNEVLNPHKGYRRLEGGPCPGIGAEFRTTVHRRLLSPDDLRRIKDGWLGSSGDIPWYLQQFRRADCFDPSLNDESTYTDSELADLAVGLGAHVRGVSPDLQHKVEEELKRK